MSLAQSTLLAVAAFLASGCHMRSRAGYFDDAAFYAARGQYRVRYVPGGEVAQALMGPEWRIQNFQLDRRGRPTRYRGPFDVVQIDENRDGFDDVQEWEPAFELQLATHDAEVLVQSRPAPYGMSPDLALLTRTMVEALESGAARSHWGPRGMDVEITFRTLEDGPVELDQQAAHRIVVEAIGTTQSEQTVLGMIDLVVTRPPMTWSRGNGPGAAGDQPMITFFCLLAEPSTYGPRRADFESLLARTDFGAGPERAPGAPMRK